MHYIPFINEDKRNTYEKINCKHCPLFNIKPVNNEYYIGYCKYNKNLEGAIISCDTESVDITHISNCPVKYKDPMKDFHYMQVYWMINNEFVNSYIKLEKGLKDGNLSNEEKEILEKRIDKFLSCSKLLSELFPKHEEMYKKIMNEGYKLDDDMNLYKL